MTGTVHDLTSIAPTSNKIAAGHLRELANTVESGELGDVEYGFVLLSRLDYTPTGFAIGPDMAFRRDKLTGVLFMAAMKTATEDWIEKL